MFVIYFFLYVIRMSSFGKKQIRVSPTITKLVKKSEATSFNAWCKRKGMTTRQGKATKACVKKAMEKKVNLVSQKD